MFGKSIHSWAAAWRTAGLSGYGLHDDPQLGTIGGSTRTTRHLRDQLSTFRCSEVRKLQGGVGTHHADQPNSGKSSPLAIIQVPSNTGAARPNAPESRANLGVRRFGLSRPPMICVQMRQFFSQHFFQTLGAQTKLDQAFSTVGTRGRQTVGPQTVVADVPSLQSRRSRCITMDASHASQRKV